MNLDLVLGMSCNNISCLACDRNSSLVAHTAAGVLVILDAETNSQVKYIHLNKNCVSSVNFSSDGKLIVTGEIGYRPAARIWRVKDGVEIASLYGHDFGIKYVLFSPSMDVIVTVGLEHDNEVNVWAWPEKHRLATNKIVDIIRAVAFSECGKFFVTAGCRHLKFWYPNFLSTETFQTTVPIVQPLYGRPGILGNNKHHNFLDITCGNGVSNGLVYAITKTGDLIILTAEDRQIKSHTSIEGAHATCAKVENRILFLGFSGGHVHLFHSIFLVHLAALPVPAFFIQTPQKVGGIFTMVYNPNKTLLTTAYKNSCMCIWDINDLNNIKQKYVAVYHSKAIANVDIFMSNNIGEPVRETLVTVSHDYSVHLWGIQISNFICYDRLSILYTEMPPASPEVTQSDESQEDDRVITTVKVSPDRKYIVTGNKMGNIFVYSKDTYEHTMTILAHNREVTCLAFYSNKAGNPGTFILVSGSRDRLIHVMDGKNDFQLVTTLNIHSSSITALMIYEFGGIVCMISCAADRSLSICTAAPLDKDGNEHPPLFHLTKCASIVSSPADITLNFVTEQLALGCQDGYVRILDMALLQEKRMFRGCPSEEGQIQKISLDDKGSLLVTAASDRTINVINFYNGDILITVPGHTKFVTGLLFSSTGDRIISTSMDGCIFIWRLTEKLLMKRKEITFCTEASRLIKVPEDISYKQLLLLFNKINPEDAAKSLQEHSKEARGSSKGGPFVVNEVGRGCNEQNDTPLSVAEPGNLKGTGEGRKPKEHVLEDQNNLASSRMLDLDTPKETTDKTL
ncbi:mitogen-activated protein kinase-binding protein 1-like [Biomphalaria glabrata]|uniref:Mitogen-activated protein kinase-binding protein 1-like n=2 Tax=Biomphalaria glabrata TaxID=6526 RepID=A0A9W2Z2T4_BIOGL|nr:mitogen-activated protein kinase-binding protein 1-like [Biomphalaria glabrata]XP_055869251.1 mitogen-activated protein kinase-binding protein 1-like [Biomphalaria glabrata]